MYEGEQYVTLPYSATRRVPDAFCMLILRAPRLVSTGLGPWGVDRVYYRAGKTIKRTQLWPTVDAPREPIVIEATTSPNSRPCPGGGEDLYVLWRYDMPYDTAHGVTKARREGWREIARCTSKRGEWWPNLHPILLRELARTGAEPREPNLTAIATETAAYLDGRLHDLTGKERAEMLIAVHDQLAHRIAAASGHWLAVSA